MSSEKSTATRYICQQCGACCRIPGYVAVTAREIELISAELNMNSDVFVQRYTQIGPGRSGLVLIDGEGDNCIFLTEDHRCLINRVKPEQCRTFPNGWNYPGFRDICCAKEAKD